MQVHSKASAADNYGKQCAKVENAHIYFPLVQCFQMSASKDMTKCACKVDSVKDILLKFLYYI